MIDDAVRRMVRKKLEHGLDQPSDLDRSVLANEEHLALAREAAVKGSVLLRNESSALPLDMSALERIVVVGVLADTPNTGDNGSSNTFPDFVVTPLQGIQDAVGDEVAVDHIGTDVLDAEGIDGDRGGGCGDRRELGSRPRTKANRSSVPATGSTSGFRRSE